MFVDYNAQFISTPLFVLQPKYDSWQVTNVSRPKRIVCASWSLERRSLGCRCCVCQILRSGATTADVQAMGNSITNTIKTKVLQKPANGAFIEGCYHHTGSWGDIHIDGMDQPAAFGSWYSGGSRVLWEHTNAYPCSTCCT